MILFCIQGQSIHFSDKEPGDAFSYRNGELTATSIFCW